MPEIRIFVTVFFKNLYHEPPNEQHPDDQPPDDHRVLHVCVCTCVCVCRAAVAAGANINVTCMLVMMLLHLSTFRLRNKELSCALGYSPHGPSVGPVRWTFHGNVSYSDLDLYSACTRLALGMHLVWL